MNGANLEDFSRLNQLHTQQSSPDQQFDLMPEASARDAEAKIEFLEDMVRKLEVALVTVMMHATHGKAHKELSAHEILLVCQRLGLRPGVADAVIGGTTAHMDGPEVPARMCPAFDGNFECRGNACGLTCEAALL